MTVPELIFDGIEVEEGDKKGECIICGKQVSNGFLFPFSDNFVGFSALKYGNVLCPKCYAFVRNQNFRKRSFVATKGKVEFLKRDEMKKKILFPPEPPFFMYLTHSHQKQGWIFDLQKVSFSREDYFLSTDFFDGAITVNRLKALAYNGLIEFLREKGISKTEIRTGNFSSKTYIKARKEGFMEKIISAKHKAGMPLWEVLVYVN